VPQRYRDALLLRYRDVHSGTIGGQAAAE
jgi:hypothetical protein